MVEGTYCQVWAQDFQNHAIAQKKVVFHLGGWWALSKDKVLDCKINKSST